MARTFRKKNLESCCNMKNYKFTRALPASQAKLSGSKQHEKFQGLKPTGGGSDGKEEDERAEREREKVH